MVCLKYIQVKFFLDSPRIQKLNVIFLFPTSRHQYKYQIVYIWDRPFNSLRASVLYDSLLAERLALGALVILFCNLHYWHVIDEAVEANLFLYFLSLQGWLKRFFYILGLAVIFEPRDFEEQSLTLFQQFPLALLIHLVILFMA